MRTKLSETFTITKLKETFIIKKLREISTITKPNEISITTTTEITKQQSIILQTNIILNKTFNTMIRPTEASMTTKNSITTNVSPMYLNLTSIDNCTVNIKTN
uniref:Uncharacterized protein n=1 Tax=Cacopsylla melanoneura TaxID=428564 RepID=A0A8D8UZQ4_9HEMI